MGNIIILYYVCIRTTYAILRPTYTYISTQKTPVINYIYIYIYRLMGNIIILYR